MICKIKLYGRSTYKYLNSANILRINICAERGAILVSIVTKEMTYNTTNMSSMCEAEKEADRLMSILNGTQEL
jgi:hypothetical protein